MPTRRALFSVAWLHFSDINVSVSEVGRAIGGKVQANTDSGVFENACPIRMSYVLNRSGMPITRDTRYAMVSGADLNWYIYRVNDMIAFLRNALGKPDATAKNPGTNDFLGKKGIIVFEGDGWANARGHVTLWDGATCSDACHFVGGAENGTFIPRSASLWTLS